MSLQSDDFHYKKKKKEREREILFKKKKKEKKKGEKSIFSKTSKLFDKLIIKLFFINLFFTMLISSTFWSHVVIRFLKKKITIFNNPVQSKFHEGTIYN